MQAEPFDHHGIRVINRHICYLCGSEGKVVHEGMRDLIYTSTPGVWSIRECVNPKCGLHWSDPQPVEEELGKLYTSYFTHGGIAAHVRGDRWNRWKRACYNGVRYSALGYETGDKGKLERLGNFGGRIMSLFPQIRDRVSASMYWLPQTPGGKLLDVGCGSGEALAMFRDLGWNVSGIDPDPVAAACGRESRSVEVTAGFLEAASYPENHFDYVTLHHVIEHLPDVTRTLKAVHHVLKPGGRLLVATPNTQSRGSRKFGKSWLGWDSPRHLNIFSQKSMPHAIELGGLRLIKQWTCARQASWLLACRDAIEENGSLPGLKLPWPPSLKSRMKRAWYGFTESLFCPMSRWGEELVVLAEKA